VRVVVQGVVVAGRPARNVAQDISRLDRVADLKVDCSNVELIKKIFLILFSVALKKKMNILTISYMMELPDKALWVLDHEGPVEIGRRVLHVQR